MSSDDKWFIWRQRCRYNYRDGCRKTWRAAAPEDDENFPFEFDSWDEALAFVNSELQQTITCSEQRVERLT